MDALKKQSRETQVVIGGALLFIILSFFDWQHYSVGGGSIGSVDIPEVSGGFSLWRGIGVLTALIAIALLVWEIVRLLQVKLELGSISQAQVSVGLALLLFVFTVITFISHNEGRYWPAWVGLIVSIAIAVAAWARGKADGFEMPSMPSTSGGASAPPPPSSTPPAGDQEPRV